MYTVKFTDEFSQWLDALKDQATQRRLHIRLRKIMLGNFGDYKSVGSGVFELREHFGAGWRMYFVRRGDILVVMLGGGNKSTQVKDIEAAINLSHTLDFTKFMQDNQDEPNNEADTKQG